MSAEILKFRIVLDADEDIFRDIEIESSCDFKMFHLAVQDAFDFDAAQMASFYMSNDNWDKGHEITLMKMDFDDGSSTEEMDKTLLKNHLNQKGQKIVYVFDFLLMWCFFIELIALYPAEKDKKYPYLLVSYGDSPDQYSKEVLFKQDDEMLLLKNKGRSPEDVFGREYDEDDDDEFGNFENIDDLDL